MVNIEGLKQLTTPELPETVAALTHDEIVELLCSPIGKDDVPYEVATAVAQRVGEVVAKINNPYYAARGLFLQGNYEESTKQFAESLDRKQIDSKRAKLGVAILQQRIRNDDLSQLKNSEIVCEIARKTASIYISTLENDNFSQENENDRKEILKEAYILAHACELLGENDLMMQLLRGGAGHLKDYTSSASTLLLRLTAGGSFEEAQPLVLELSKIAPTLSDPADLGLLYKALGEYFTELDKAQRSTQALG